MSRIATRIVRLGVAGSVAALMAMPAISATRPDQPVQAWPAMAGVDTATLLEQAQGRTAQAAQRLQALTEHGRSNGGQLLGTTAVCQHIGLLLASGAAEAAVVLLPQALEAAQGGVLQPFQRLLEDHPEWMREQLLAQPAGPVQARLLSLLPVVDTPPAPGAGTEALSAREMSVLKLIALGCSNQQISEQLFISLHTVKTHASHINSKLGVERRTQAVARAKALGLL